MKAMNEQPPLTTVHSEQTVYDGGPWLSVAHHRITAPDGMEHSHHSVRLNPVATVTIIDDHCHTLLMRRHRWVVDAIGFESPGGIIDADEDPETCARREVFEETGYVVGNLDRVAVLEPMPGLVQTPHHIYVGQAPRRVDTPTDAEEAAQLTWVPLARTVDMLASGQILGTGTAVGVLAAQSLYGGGRSAAPSR